MGTFALLLLGAPGENWLQNITMEITHLTTSPGAQLVDAGNLLLWFVSMIALMSMIGHWALSHMVIGHHAVNFQIGNFFEFLIKLMLCSSMLWYYNNPMPGGSGLNLHQIPQAVGSAIAVNLDDKSYDEVEKRITAAIDGTKQPGLLDSTGIVIYVSVLWLMAILEIGMFAVNAFGFVGYALFVLFGPLMIPLLMTKHFSGKFWRWVDGLTVFGMYGAVSAAITFIWLHVLLGFFDRTMAGDFSLGKWAAMLVALIMLSISFLWSMLKVPSLASMLFGGVGGPAQQATDAMVGGIAKVALAAI